MKHNLPKLLSFLFLIIAVASVKRHFIWEIDNTLVWWILQSFILIIIFYVDLVYINKKDNRILIFVKLYLYWNIFNFLRGAFIAENYWDWKFLMSTFLTMTPLVAYTATNTRLMQLLMYHYLRYALPLFFGIAFYISVDAYGFYLMPVSFFLLFFPILSNKWKFIMLLFAIIVLTADFTARSNVIKFFAAIILSFIYYFRHFFSRSFFEKIRLSFFIIPFILFFLAVNGIFNPFELDKYIKSNISKVEVDKDGIDHVVEITADTRTFIYTEVLQTAKKYNTWLFGRSAARGNETEVFYNEDLTGRGERYANEVLITNIFTWSGILGVLLYFLILFKATYLAINKSNNIFSIILGLFVTFRWAYAWVEDYANFSLNTFFLWIIIGLCYSIEFRSMNNNEVKEWISTMLNLQKIKREYKQRVNLLLSKNIIK